MECFGEGVCVLRIVVQKFDALLAQEHERGRLLQTGSVLGEEFFDGDPRMRLIEELAVQFVQDNDVERLR